MCAHCRGAWALVVVSRDVAGFGRPVFSHHLGVGACHTGPPLSLNQHGKGLVMNPQTIVWHDCPCGDSIGINTPASVQCERELAHWVRLHDGHTQHRAWLR